MTEDKFKKEIELIRRMYDAVYSEKARQIGWKIREGVFGSKENIGQNCILSKMDIDEIFKTANINKTHKILDVGCGDGAVAIFFAKHYGCCVSGVDHSPIGVKTAQKEAEDSKLSSLCTFQVSSIEQMPYESDSFDFIYSLDSFIHIHDKKQALAECKRILKPKEKFIFYDWVDIGGLPKEIQESGELWGFIYVASTDQYKTLIQESGFELLCITNNNKNFTDIIDKWESVNLKFKDFLVKECGEEYFNNAKKRWRLAKDLTRSNILGQSLFLCQKS